MISSLTEVKARPPLALLSTENAQQLHAVKYVPHKTAFTIKQITP